MGSGTTGATAACDIKGEKDGENGKVAAARGEEKRARV
jgi:hypothetical protein